jgi:hypothetical protein
MTKKDDHKRHLIPLLHTFLETGDAQSLLAYIVSNSNLPGRRGNLELALAFGDLLEDYARQEAARLWELCGRMVEVSPDEAPVNAPQELIPFCGAVGIGAIGSLSPALFEPALRTLRGLANDTRWRMREAVVFGLQRLLTKRQHDALRALGTWITPGEWLEMRAAAAAVAEPTLLKNRETAVSALQLHRQIMDHVVQTQDRRPALGPSKGSERFRVLRKGLGYTLSVVVRALPEKGFAFMARLVDSGDPDALWIVKQNLKKNRLLKNFPREVESLRRRLSD